jgi:hypothetical protein
MVVLMNREVREQARKLRQQGMAVNQIAIQLKVGKSSASRWVRDIVLNPEELAISDTQRARLTAQNKGARKNLELALERRKSYQLEGREKARENHVLHRQGCLLYWAEGAKARNKVVFVNSDSAMMLLFLRFLREELLVPERDLRLIVHCHARDLNEISRIENYWMMLLRLPKSSLLTTQIKKGSTSRKNILENGICTIGVNSTRIIQHIYGAIQEYAGFDRPEWLF